MVMLGTQYLANVRAIVLESSLRRLKGSAFVRGRGLVEYVHLAVRAE